MNPPPHRGCYSRGYLPHRDYPGLLQTITYRLSDSLPQSVLTNLKVQLEAVPRDLMETEKRKRIETWLDRGYGSCLLKNPLNAAMVIENWHHFARKRYDLIAWVVMPNHVHVLIRVYQNCSLGSIVQSWKSYTGRRIKQLDEEGGRAGARRSQGGPTSEDDTLPYAHDVGHMSQDHRPIWMRDYWDRFIRNEEHFYKAVDYIHRNPVKAHLVQNPEDWPWSSASECNTRKSRPIS